MRRLKPICFFIFFTAIFFRKTLIFGLIPAPFDLLVAWFFPYLSGGWTDPGIWTLYKGGNFASDAIRQIYPWKELAISLIKQSQFPLWNPYAFSGTPLLANMQTAVFYPMNFLFFIIPNFPFAWAAYIISTLLLGLFFMYLFLKSLKLTDSAAIFGSIAFAASGYMIVWLEWGTVAHQLIWLPLSLFALKRWWDSRKVRFLLLLVFSASSTIFAGYPQGAAYNFIIVFTWFLCFLKNTAKKQRLSLAFPIIISAILVIGLTAIQWMPTMELYFNSAMRGEVSQKLSKEAALPFAQFATLLAPDYFGNRVTNDYWAKQFSGVDYMDADLYVGATTLLLVVSAILISKKTKEVKWLILLFILGVILGAKTPIVSFIAGLGIPVISTGAASEALIISIFSLCCLAAIGLQGLLDRQTKTKAKPAVWIIGSLYIALLIISLFFEQSKAAIAQNSLLVPLTGFVLVALLILLDSKRKIHPGLLGIAFILVLTSELLLHAEKILPFSYPNFVFPKHQLIEELKRRSSYYRVAGFWDSEIATNFHTVFRLYSLEGYDPLYIRRYGEFVTAAEEGKLPVSVPRSDADITMENEENRNRLIDLASVRYIPAKVTNQKESWEEEPLKYDPSRFRLVWQKDNFKIYENPQALPRAKLFYDWQVISDDEEVIKTLYDQQFNPHEQVILKMNPGIKITSDAEQYNESRGATITDYKPNLVEIQTQSPTPAILLLTDSFYPGWKATVDENPAEILRTNYTFRSVVVPSGNHQVIFSYKPVSFKFGKAISAISLSLILLFLLVINPLRAKG
jgi:hypothetical protein